MSKLRLSTLLMIFASFGFATVNGYGDMPETQDQSQQPAATETEPAPQPEPAPRGQKKGPAPKVKVTPTPEGTKVLTSDEGHFSIAIPPEGFSEVDMDAQSVDTDAGAIKTVNYSASSEHSTYIVGSSTYPKAILETIVNKEQEIFEGAQEGLLMHMKGQVSAKKDLTVDGHKARVIEFHAMVDNETLYGRLELILAEPRLYHILYITNKKDELDGKDANAFFDSIKILP